MPRSIPVSLVVLLGLAACDDDNAATNGTGPTWILSDLEVPADADSARKAVHRELGEHAKGVAVVALDPAATWAVIGATSPAVTATHGVRITIDTALFPHDKLDREVRILDDTGAAVAVDLALLHIAGIALPERLPLGTRSFTETDKKGTPRVGPGDLVVAMLRNQNAAALNPRPDIDVVYPLGFVRGGAGAWPARCEQEVRAAAGRYAQLQLQVRDAGGDPGGVTRCIGELLDAGCRAIVASIDDPAQLGASRERCDAARIALLALDPRLRPGATCCIGADQDVLGRTAAERLRANRPDGAKIVLVRTAGDPLADLRAAGFAAALGLSRP
jgi:hypothetical protein